MDPSYRSLARHHLDAALDPLREVDLSPPPDGWIRTLRQALGMSHADLAARIGVSQQRVSQYEAAEREGTLKLETLERIARGLGGQLRYAIVTEVPLEQMVSNRARTRAERELAAVDHSMSLELQRPDRDAEELIAQRARELESSSTLWSEPG